MLRKDLFFYVEHVLGVMLQHYVYEIKNYDKFII